MPIFKTDQFIEKGRITWCLAHSVFWELAGRAPMDTNQHREAASFARSKVFCEAGHFFSELGSFMFLGLWCHQAGSLGRGMCFAKVS